MKIPFEWLGGLCNQSYEVSWLSTASRPPMSVTPSISSARSLLSPSGIHNEQTQRSPGISPSIYLFSKSLPSAKLPNEGLSLNPDELFTKYTVSEVRAVQHRLRLFFFLLVCHIRKLISRAERMPMQSRRNFGLWLGAHFWSWEIVILSWMKLKAQRTLSRFIASLYFYYFYCPIVAACMRSFGRM